MSRIGKLPIKLPENVNIKCTGPQIIVTGKFGTLQNKIPNNLGIQQNEDNLVVQVKNETRTTRALHGLYRTLINNMIIGVSQQFQITLNLKGVGYRASVQGNSLILNLGYSHPVQIEIPKEITVEVIQNTTLTLKGCDKENLGLFAAKVRSWRPPEPYKGKGIIYQGETIKRKAGKSGKK
jgi:large subunit ribosomal protein L6